MTVAAASRPVPQPGRFFRHGVLTLALATVLGGGLAAGVADARPTTGTSIAIPSQRFVLPNGLTVLVHEDHKAPVVSVAVWYHVGSKDEPAGKTGFAHLVEHLMC